MRVLRRLSGDALLMLNSHQCNRERDLGRAKPSCGPTGELRGAKKVKLVESEEMVFSIQVYD